MKSSATLPALGPIAIGLALALLGPAAIDAARPPIGRTYLVVSIGMATDASQAYELDLGCVTFTATEICAALDCGTWRLIDEPDKGRRQRSIEFELETVDDESGEPVEITGRADLDNRGAKSALGGAAVGVMPQSGRTLNFALGGRAIGAERCARIVADFETGG